MLAPSIDDNDHNNHQNFEAVSVSVSNLAPKICETESRWQPKKTFFLPRFFSERLSQWGKTSPNLKLCGPSRFFEILKLYFFEFFEKKFKKK